MKTELLLQVTRANLIEREHFGFIVLVDKNENILSQVGNKNFPLFFLRSCEKPIQAYSIITSGAYTKFNLSLQELAVCCASHVASFDHIKTVKNILDKIGLTENHLQCGSQEPIDQETRNYLIKNDIKPSAIHNNCSGKHAGMLAVCITKGWPVENYLDRDHPLQKEILSTIKTLCCLDGNVETSTDGCTAPTHGMPLHKIGSGFLKLFLNPDAEPIKRAFMEYPVLIGGKERIDTEIIRATNGRLISKLGAEGLCTAINPEKEQALVVKILDSNVNARSIVMIEALKQLGWITEKELQNSNLNKLYDLDVKNHRKIVIGKVKPVFELKEKIPF